MTLDRAELRRYYRYWVRDPVVGARLAALHHLMRMLPTDAASAIGGRLGQLAGPRLHRAAETRARACLARLRPDLAQDERALAGMWDALGRVYAEFSAEDRLWPEGRVEVRGKGHALPREPGRRPLIVAGVHLGNWELLPITLGYLGHQITDIYQPQRNRFEDRIAMQTRLRSEREVVRTVPRSGLHLVSPSRTIGSELLRALQAGHALMIFVDEHVGGRVHAPSFGRPMRSDGNLTRAVRLARMAGADIVPGYVERLAGARFIVHFLPALSLQRTTDKDADIRANCAALDAAITGPVLDHIAQWFMLPDFRFDR